MINNNTKQVKKRKSRGTSPALLYSCKQKNMFPALLHAGEGEKNYPYTGKCKIN